MPRPTPIALLLAALALAPLSPLASPLRAEPPAAEIRLPDTTPAKVARGFLDMINAATPEAVRAFEGDHASKKRLAAVPLDERVTRVKDMNARWGALRVVEIVESTDRSISLVADGAAGVRLEMDFKFDESDQGKLEAVMVASDGARPSPITPEERSSLVESACAALEAGYVFPDLGSKMAAAARAKLKAGDYAALATDSALARRLTEDFRAVSRDLHLAVRVAPPQARPSHDHDESQSLVRMAGDNFGFRKVEVLPGNVGYIKFDLFVDHDDAKKTASAALAFVQNADALIFDLRANGGGAPDMIRYISSYLFDSRTHLNDMLDRNATVVQEFWTLDDVPGKRLPPSLPVYVLTSSRTFSGAEEFAYNLKNLKRATIVGETTGGGAHPVRSHSIAGNLVLALPHMRARNPISGTNWEGVGVTPDIQAPADQALERALADIRANAPKGRR